MDYDQFAWVYERHWSREVPSQILTVIERLITAELPRGAHLLDLCCGTGYTARELTERGFEVTGIDISKEMLAHARRRAPTARFILGDARHFKLPAGFQAVVSTFDSLNHIMSLSELGAVFRNVYGVLMPSGLFLFDMNMERGFTSYWADYYSIVEDDGVCVMRGAYDKRKRLARYDITMFRRRGNVWKRTDTVITERCYSPVEIKRALRAAGFKHISTFDAERDLGLSEHTGRSFFLARKAD